MIRIAYEGTAAMFHADYRPSPLDPLYPLGAWLTWGRACLVNTEVSNA